jgi:serine/threonine protein kinase
MPLAVDSLLHNRYRIHKIIAQGGMGAIYRAYDETLAIDVAVKENLITSQESSRQFHREATILAGVRHPNLPRVTDHFVIPDQGQYLVMDYIPGEDLRQRIDRKGPLAESEAVLIITAACDALNYLHNSQPPIIHRDIKPGNLKVTSEGHVYLVDFGLAKISRADQATTTGAQALTPGYAPPEQYGHGTDSRSDLYSLGATLYAALTGKIPEDGLARATGTSRLTPPRTHNPNMSVSLAAVIEKAMSINPAQRYQTAVELKQALLEANTAARRTLEDTRQVRVTPAPPSQPSPLQTIRSDAGSSIAAAQQKPASPAISPAAPSGVTATRKIPWIGIIVALVILIGGGTTAAILLSGNQSKSPTEDTSIPIAAAASQTAPVSAIAAQPTETAQPTATVTQTIVPTEVAVALPTATFTPAVTPLGGYSGQIAFASDRTGVPQVFIWEGMGGEPRQLTNFPDGACQPDWSPDGNRIVFISPCPEHDVEYSNSSLFILNADGSGLVSLDTMPGGDFEPAWSPDGNTIAFVSLRERIPHVFLYDLASNQVSRISAPSSNDRHPAWSVDGSKIAFDTTRIGGLQVWTMNPDGTNAREFSPAGGNGDSMAAWSPDGAAIYYASGSNQPVLRVKSVGEAGAQERQISDIQPVWNPSVSPDSSLIAYEGLLNGNLAIFIINQNGGEPQNIISHAGADFDPAWKPR